MASQPALFTQKYSPEIMARALERIAKGDTMTSIADDENVSVVSFWRWMRDGELAKIYEEARLAGAHAIADKALAIIEEEPPKVEGRIDPGHVQWARARVDTRLKLLARWFPQQYGDKILHAGHDGGAIKSEQAFSIKELAAQLRAARSGVTIEGNATGVLQLGSGPDADGSRLDADGAVLVAGGEDGGSSAVLVAGRAISSEGGATGAGGADPGEGERVPSSAPSAISTKPSPKAISKKKSAPSKKATPLKNSNKKSTTRQSTTSLTPKPHDPTPSEPPIVHPSRFKDDWSAEDYV